MNMISKLRHRIYGCTAATISAEEYDQLQREWITRAGAEDLILAEREACAAECEGIVEPPYYGYENPNTFASAKDACAEAIRARSNPPTP